MSTHPDLKILMLEDVPEEAEVLQRELRRAGLAFVAHVRGLDPRYAAFAAQLQALAEGYQSSAISSMIERYSNSCSRSGS